MADQQMVVSETMLEALRGTSPWVKFMAIMMFIFSGLMALVGIAMLGMGSVMAKLGGMPASFGLIFGVLYLLLAFVFMFVPGLYLLRYGQAITLIPQSGQPAMESALVQQRKYWRYMGIMMIVVLVLYALIFVGAIGFGIFAAMAHHG